MLHCVALFALFQGGFGAITETTNYIYNSDAKSWTDAEQWCLTTYNTHLATVCDDTQNAEIKNHAPDTWIGKNDRATEGKWVYSSGNTCAYTKWQPGEPNNSGDEDCAYVMSNLNWNDGGCGAKLKFACDKPQYQKTENFALLADKLSYANANAKCKTLFGTQLATICTAEDNAEIVKVIGSHASGNVWIGFNDKNSEGTFQWNSGNDCAYTNWRVGEPYKKRFVTGNTNNEDCTYIPKDGFGQWRTYDCGSTAHGLCDLRKDHASAHEKVADLTKVVNSMSDRLTKLQKYVTDLVTRVRTAIGLELTANDDDIDKLNNNDKDNENMMLFAENDDLTENAAAAINDEYQDYNNYDMLNSNSNSNSDSDDYSAYDYDYGNDDETNDNSDYDYNNKDDYYKYGDYDYDNDNDNDYSYNAADNDDYDQYFHQF